MAANQAFVNLLQQIQMSSLNFKIELSPFSAIIHLKKSFIKDKSGANLQPQPCPNVSLTQNGGHDQKINELEHKVKSSNEELEAMKVKNGKLWEQLAIQEENSKKQCEKIIELESENNASQNVLAKLEEQIEIKKEKTEHHINKICDLKDEVNDLSSELYNTKIELTKQHEQTAELKLMKAEAEDMLKIADAKTKLQADYALENKQGWDDLEVDSSIQTTFTRILLTDESPLTSPKA